MRAPWPVTIIPNPCAGEVAWLAIACEPHDLWLDATVSCRIMHAWRSRRDAPPVGEGDTPNAALADLLSRIQARKT